MKRNYKQELELFLKRFENTYGKLQYEYKFHDTRRWRFDYCFPDYHLAIEYEGQAYRSAKSGHTTISGFQSDCEKYNEALIAGWKVFRFTAKMIETGLAFRQLEHFIYS